MEQRLEDVILRTLKRHPAAVFTNTAMEVDPAQATGEANSEQTGRAEQAEQEKGSSSTNARFVMNEDTGKACVPQTSQANSSQQSYTFKSGQLSNNLLFWESLSLSDFVHSTLKCGLSIVFKKCFKLPHSVTSPRNSCWKHKDFVDSEIEKLLQTEAIVEKTTMPALCSPLHVVVGNSGKRRLILDLTELNKGVKKFKVKFDDLSKVQYCLPEGGYMAKFDLRAGYHQVKMKADASDLLGFKWKEKYYCFRVLPFGLCTGPAVFTKIFRVLVKNGDPREFK